MGLRSKTVGTVLVTAVLSLGSAGCGDGGDPEIVAGRPADFAATPEYLAGAIEQSQNVPHRFEGNMTLGETGDQFSSDGPPWTGVGSGEWIQYQADLRSLAEEMVSQLPEGHESLESDLLEMISNRDDLWMESITDDATLFVRAPVYAAADELVDVIRREVGAEFGNEGNALNQQLVAAGDGWTRIDLTEVEEALPAEVAVAQGIGQDLSPRAYLDMVVMADEVQELGSSELDGKPVTGLAAELSLRTLVEELGIDPDVLSDATAGSDRLDDLDVDIEVWLDSDGHLRRVTLDTRPAIAELPDNLRETLSAFDYLLTLDLFDYGDPSIAIVVPERAVDVTAEYISFMEETAPD